MAFLVVFSIDVAFVNATSELPDIFTQNSTKACEKSHKKDFFSEKMSSGNTELLFLA